MSRSTIAWIVFVGGQVVAFALIYLETDVLKASGRVDTVFVVLIVGTYGLAMAAAVFIWVTEIIPGFGRAVARFGWLPIVGSLFDVGKTDFEDVMAEVVDPTGADQPAESDEPPMAYDIDLEHDPLQSNLEQHRRT